MGEQRKKMRSQASKTLSRLNIIKRRMDVEESKKLRTSLAQADDEIRMKNVFNLEMTQRERAREERQPVGNIEIGGGQNFLQSENNIVGKPSTVKKNNSTMENSSLSIDTVSSISTKDLMLGPVLPSLDTIRNSRQHELLQPSQLY